MTCSTPIKAYWPKDNAADGRLVFDIKRAHPKKGPLEIPCGQCMGCRVAKASEWATRMLHEVKVHAKHACHFATFTYSPEALEQRGSWSVSKNEHQLLMKRMRKHYGQFRFFMCAEYGSQFKRPHYHYVLFGLALPDLKPLMKSKSGALLTASPTLEQIWGNGFVQIGKVTEQSCRYVAGYVTKRLTGENAADHYLHERTNPTTGEIVTEQCEPEFGLMSRRPGLGSEWFERWGGDAFPSDFLITNGKKRPVPRFYRSRLGEEEKKAAGERANQRRIAAEKREIELQLEHLAVEKTEQAQFWGANKQRDRAILLKRRETRAEITRLNQERKKRELE